MAEIDFDSEYSFKPFVFQKEDVVVKGDSLHLGIPFFHAHQRTFNIPYRYRQDSLQKVFAHLAVSEREYNAFAASAREDKVALHMSQTPPFVDFAWSFVDHAFAFNTLF